MCSHHLDTGRRLERAEEDGRADAVFRADDVRAPVDAIRAVDVESSGGPEHRRVAACPASERVARGIVRLVRLRLDDDSADAVDEERPPDEVARNVARAALEERVRWDQK